MNRLTYLFLVVIFLFPTVCWPTTPQNSITQESSETTSPKSSSKEKKPVNGKTLDPNLKNNKTGSESSPTASDSNEKEKIPKPSKQIKDNTFSLSKEALSQLNSVIDDALQPMRLNLNGVKEELTNKESFRTLISEELSGIKKDLADVKQKVEPPTLWQKVKDGFIVNILWGLVSGDDAHSSTLATGASVLGIILTLVKFVFFFIKKSAKPLDVGIMIYAFVMASALLTIVLTGGVAQKAPSQIKQIDARMEKLQVALEEFSFPEVPTGDDMGVRQINTRIDELQETIMSTITASGLSNRTGSAESIRLSSEVSGQLRSLEEKVKQIPKKKKLDKLFDETKKDFSNQLNSSKSEILEIVHESLRQTRELTDDAATDGIQLFNTLLLIVIIIGGLYVHKVNEF